MTSPMAFAPHQHTYLQLAESSRSFLYLPSGGAGWCSDAMECVAPVGQFHGRHRPSRSYRLYLPRDGAQAQKGQALIYEFERKNKKYWGGFDVCLAK